MLVLRSDDQLPATDAVLRSTTIQGLTVVMSGRYLFRRDKNTSSLAVCSCCRACAQSSACAR